MNGEHARSRGYKKVNDGWNILSRFLYWIII